MFVAKRLENDNLCGGSKARVFTDFAGRKWTVKAKNNPQGLAVLPAEYINGRLAGRLGVPVPEVATIQIPQALIQAQDIQIDPPGNAEQWLSGISFGSLYIESSHNNPTMAEMINLSNPGDIAATVMFDTWIDNGDRCNNHSNLLVSVDGNAPNKWRYYCIDLGTMGGQIPFHCQGLSGVKANFTYRGLNQFFQIHLLTQAGLAAFGKFLTRLEQLTRNDIEEVVNEVPQEWAVCQKYAQWSWADSDKEAVVNYLDERRNKVRGVLEKQFSPKLIP